MPHITGELGEPPFRSVSLFKAECAPLNRDAEAVVNERFGRSPRCHFAYMQLVNSLSNGVRDASVVRAVVSLGHLAIDRAGYRVEIPPRGTVCHPMIESDMARSFVAAASSVRFFAHGSGRLALLFWSRRLELDEIDQCFVMQPCQ